MPTKGKACFPESFKNVYSSLFIDKVGLKEKLVRTLKKYIFREMQGLGVNPRDVARIVITHTHPDHIGGLPDFHKSSEPEVLVHRAEARFVESIGVPPEKILSDGDVVNVGSCSLHVIHTPGHSPGSICLYEPGRKILFSGDTVFAYGIGRFDLPGGSIRQLASSISRLLRLEVDLLLPGHGNIVLKGASRNLEANYRYALSLMEGRGIGGETF